MGNDLLTDCRCCADESKIGNYDNSATFHFRFCLGSFFNDPEGPVISRSLQP